MNRPVSVAFICFIAGILLALFVKISAVAALIVAAAFILFSFIFNRINRTTSIIFIFLSIIFLSIAHFSNYTFIGPDHILNNVSKNYNKVCIKGRIVSEPVHQQAFLDDERATFVLNAEYFKQENSKSEKDWIKTQGRCKVFVYQSGRDYKYGDNYIIKGVLKIPPLPANPGEFDYAQYLKHKNIYVTLNVDSDRDVILSPLMCSHSLLDAARLNIFAFRDKINHYIHQHISKPEADLISVMMLGLRSELPHASKDIFIKTGTAHILAISGLHLALIAYVIFFIFGIMRIPYKGCSVLTIIIICCYAILCGGRPSVVRASIMICAFLIARVLNRDVDAYNSLSLAGILILLINPLQLFSIGFILSFACVFSLIYLSPKIIEAFKIKTKNKFLVYLLKALAVSTAIYIGILPIIAYNFNIISPITIISNLLILPLAGLLICAGIVFILFGLPLVSLASIFAPSVWLIAFSLKKLVFYLSKIPFAYFYIADLPIWIIVVYYVLIALITYHKKIKLSKAITFIIVLVCVNFYIWTPLLQKPSEQLKVSFLHVGHGDAIFIQFPDGKTMLVDAGEKTQNTDKGRDVVLPYMWSEGRNSIDCVIVTHPDTDHYGGIYSVIQKTNPKYFLHNGAESNQREYRKLSDLIKSRSIKSLTIKEGDKIEGFNGVEILVFNPPQAFLKRTDLDKNDSSIVLKLTYKNVSFLLCADILNTGIENILSYGQLLESDIIKVPHHGSKLHNNVAGSLYNFTKAKVAIIPAAKRSIYPTPSASTMKVLSENGIKPYITYRDGAIIITTDGETFDISTTYSRNSI